MPPTIDPLAFLVVGLVGVIGSGLVIFFGWRMYQEERAQKEKEERREAVVAQAQAAMAPAAPPTGVVGNILGALAGGRASSAPSAPGAHEVLRILRHDLTGRLVIEVGRRRYQHLSEIENAALREGVLANVRDLQAFVQDGAVPTPAVAQAMPAAEPVAPKADWLAERMGAGSQAQPASPTPKVAPTPKPTPTSAAPSPEAIAGAGASDALVLPSMNPFKQMEILRELAKKPKPVLKSIPEQIDEVLQTKIEGTLLTQRGLKVSTSPKGTVVFELDGKSYEALDELPDATVRATVKEAIAEWEKRR